MVFERELEKQIAELKEKISILLSCKNCPENKGGLICQKEYENKCLAQKIQYIKELLEENTELRKKVENLQKYLDTQNCYRECAETWVKFTKAKELLAKWVELFKPKSETALPTPIQVDTEQFLNSEVEK